MNLGEQDKICISYWVSILAERSEHKLSVFRTNKIVIFIDNYFIDYFPQVGLGDMTIIYNTEKLWYVVTTYFSEIFIINL